MRNKWKANEIVELLARTKLFAGVDRNVIEYIVTSGFGNVKTFYKGERVIRASDVIESVGVVLEGTILISRLSKDGFESTVHVLKERKTIGLEFVQSQNYKSIFDFTAQTAVTTYNIDKKYLLDKMFLGEETVNRLLFNMIGLLSHENLRQNQKLNILSKGSIRKKLLTFLCYEYEKCNSREFDISFNRESLAAYLSVNRSALSRELSQMEKEKIIKTKGKHFKILDEKALYLDTK